MAPLETIQHIYLGAEFGQALCHTCHSKVSGAVVLAEYHNGYGKEASPPTDAQLDALYDATEAHPQEHDMKIVIGHAEERKDENGNSVVVYLHPTYIP